MYNYKGHNNCLQGCIFDQRKTGRNEVFFQNVSMCIPVFVLEIVLLEDPLAQQHV